MKKTLVTISVVVSAIALTTSIVYAAGFTTDWLKVGKQGTGGVTYFNGTIINETTGTGGIDNPVTFGDNVRIDGRVYRGAIAGTGDTMPFIVNDNMEIAGNLTVAGNIIYDNSASGLSAATVKGAIDEIGTSLANKIYNGSEESTWNGSMWRVTCPAEEECYLDQEENISVIFAPESETEGTFISTDFVFNRNGQGAYGGEHSDDEDVIYEGSYTIINDKLLYEDFWAQGVDFPPDQTDTRKGGGLMTVELRGNEISWMDQINEWLVILTKQ